MYITNKTAFESDPSFVSSHHHINRTRTITQAMGTAENGKTLVKAGTVFPANDATAEGIVYYTVDVTHGDQPGSVMVEGYVLENRLPAAVSAAAKTAMKEIKFEKYNATEAE